jgi:hypothetical protein
VAENSRDRGGDCGVGFQSVQPGEGHKNARQLKVFTTFVIFKYIFVRNIAPIVDEMKVKIRHLFGCRYLVILLMMTILAFEVGCSSSYKGAKGRGQVPCPCEKKSHRK